MSTKKEKKILKACKDIVLPGTTDVMPIAGYYGPHRPITSLGRSTPDYVTDSIFKMIADAGVNLICYTECRYTTQPDEWHDILRLAEKYNIGVFMWDDRITKDTTEDELEKYLADGTLLHAVGVSFGMVVKDGKLVSTTDIRERALPRLPRKS